MQNAAVGGGFRRVDAIPGTFSVPAAGVTLRDTPFFDDSTVPVFGGDLGVLFAASRRVSLGVEAGVRYHTDLSQIEGLAGTGLPRSATVTLHEGMVPEDSVQRVSWIYRRPNRASTANAFRRHWSGAFSTAPRVP